MRTRSIALGSVSLSVAVAAVFPACSSSSSSSSSNGDASTYVVHSPPITIAASSEKYLCYAFTLDQDLAVDKFDYQSKDYVHHVILAQTTQPEPDGVTECNVAFRTSWLPLYLGGKGASTLQYPTGSANVMPKGTQIVMQVHLLNPSSVDQPVNVQIAMHKSSLASPTPVGVFAFGTQYLALPPGAKSSVTNECAPSMDVTAFAAFAHEHQIGTKLTFEVMGADGQYKNVYTRDPFDFNDQKIETMPISIPKGTKTRITCSYDNKTNATVTYGESSFNEMCYLITFVPGRSGAFGCVKTQDDSDGGAGGDGGTCMATANSIGVGKPCTGGGNECGSGLSCSADLQNAAAGTAGFCMKVGCSHTADCGEGATCCSPKQGGGVINVCLPSSCVPADCSTKN